MFHSRLFRRVSLLLSGMMLGAVLISPAGAQDEATLEARIARLEAKTQQLTESGHYKGTVFAHQIQSWNCKGGKARWSEARTHRIFGATLGC